MFKYKGTLALMLGAFSVSGQASPVTPSSDVWGDSNGYLYYQQPVKQVTTADDAPVSIRVHNAMPYVRVVEAANGYRLEYLSKKDFTALRGELDVIGKRLRSDFDGDGQPDILMQSDLGHELLISNGQVRPYRIGIDLRDIGAQMQVRDVNYDFRSDFVNPSAELVHHAQATGLSSAINTNDYVGSLPAESNVSPSGEFTYSVPITTGESTGGLKPSVSLSYASNPNNGHVGVGFAIGGLSAITRCEQNMETDGKAGAVNFDTNDRFCLDGQRLIVKSGQAYGANNTEYRTRQNSGQKIIAHTSNTSTGPYAFTVTDVQGNKYTYGKYSSTSDALINAKQGKAFTWALKRVQDASGNYYTYHYTKVSGSLEYYPTAVKYSGHGTGGTRNEIRFIWETRLDKHKVSYLKGNKIGLTKRLKQVESYYSGNLLRKYKLTYSYIGTGVTQSALQKVQACSSDNSCLSPTEFNWNARGSIRLGSDIGRDYSRNSRYKAHQFMDFNGDGLTDIAFVRNDRGSSSDHLYMIPNTGNGFGDERRFNDIATKTFRKTWKVIDYDKDGKDDILYMKGNSQYWQLMRHTSAMNFRFSELNRISKPSSDDNTRFLDIDADGYPELLHLVGNKLSYQKGTKNGLASGTAKALKFNLSAPNGSTATMLSYDKEDNTFQAMDFNGDGRADFLAQVRVSTYTSGGGGGGDGGGGGGDGGGDGGGGDCDIEGMCEDPVGIEPIESFSASTQHLVSSTANLGDKFGGQVERLDGGSTSLNSESAPITPVNLSQLNSVNMVGGPAATAALQAEQAQLLS